MVDGGVLRKLMNDCAGLVIFQPLVFGWPVGSLSRHSGCFLQNGACRRTYFGYRPTYDSSLANFRTPGFLRKRIDFGVISTSSSSLMNSRARSSPISR